jgi:hypothetical protein
VIKQFQDAAATPSAANWQTFDRDAWDVLNRLKNTITVDNRYADKLGGMYVAVLPLYLHAHLVGSQWGIKPTSDSLEHDVVNAARDGLGFSYDMVGAKRVMGSTQDTTSYSILYSYVKEHSLSHCYNSAGICAAYFQTNATVQAVQIAANSLFGILQAAKVNRPADLKDKRLGTVTVFPIDSWANNWQGYADAFWTSMQEYTENRAHL